MSQRGSGALFGAFLQTERAPGYLAALSDEERGQALAALRPEAPSVAATLVFAALRPMAHWQDYIFDWQPALSLGLAAGAIRATEEAAQLAGALLRTTVRHDELDKRLRWAADYIDDDC